MTVAGCDVGSLTSKAVILHESKILASALIRSRSRPEESAREVMALALSKAALTLPDITYCVSTGYGRDKIAFANEAVSEISCHGRGARWLMPGVQMIIDIGGQDCKAIRLDKDGKIIKFTTNDKCASGTGRFLEVMARHLGIRLDELGELSAQAKNPLNLAAACTVWAQAEVIHHFNDGKSIPDICAAVNQAMAKRVAIIVNSLGTERNVCISGGVAKNAGVVKALENLLGVKVKRLPKVDPQLVGALGAAVLAYEKVTKGGNP
ncbi:MAG TPA: acyl-CoA dehydratase activase [Deltaproteobacteria bacterium]|nr:acyl-CoA dehydratase activase [Deltaproteobacteria bacterium]